MNQRHIISSSWDATLRIFNRRTGECDALLQGHDLCVHCFAISEAQRTLVSGSIDRKLKVWDVETAQLLTTLQRHKRGVGCLSWLGISTRKTSYPPPYTSSAGSDGEGKCEEDEEYHYGEAYGIGGGATARFGEGKEGEGKEGEGKEGEGKEADEGRASFEVLASGGGDTEVRSGHWHSPYFEERRRQGAGGESNINSNSSGCGSGGGGGREEWEYKYAEEAEEEGSSGAGSFSLVASGSMGGDVCVWDLRTRATALEFVASKATIAGIHWHGEHQVVTGGWDGQLRLFDVRHTKRVNLQFMIYTGGGGGSEAGGAGIQHMVAEYGQHHRIGRLLACEGNTIAGWDLGSISDGTDCKGQLLGEDGLEVPPLWRFSESHKDTVSISHVDLAPGGCVSCCEGGRVGLWSFSPGASVPPRRARYK